MTETEETLVYDAMRSIQESSEIMAALANADGTPKAREAYKSGVYAPCVKLQVALGGEAMDRGKARHEKIAKEAAAYFANGKLSDRRREGASPASCSAFSPGSWWLMEFGYGYERFYIAEVVRDKVRLSMPSWLASSGVWMTRREMDARRAEYLGLGKRKWYWRFLPWRDCVTPVYRPNDSSSASAQ